MIELKIQNYEDRKSVVMGLVNSGYTIRIDERRKNNWTSADYYVQIIENEETEKSE